MKPKGSVVTQNSNTQGLFDWFTTSVAQNPDMVTTESEWQSENTANGMCGKFVYTAESTTNYYAYTSGETTYFTTSTDDSESVNVYNSEFELQGTGSISSGVLTYNTQTYNRDSESDDSVTNSATLRIPNYPKYFIGNITSGTIPVVGNNTALGIMSNDGQLGGLGLSPGAVLAPYQNLYGVQVGNGAERVVPAGGGLDTIQQLGVTTDPDKSGLEANIPDPYKIAGTYFIQIATGQETEVNITNEIELNNPCTLFDSKYTEAPLYNASWLLSNGTYYSKSVYPTAYEALAVEQNSAIEAGDSVTLPSGGSYVKRGLSVKLSTDEDITDYDFVIDTTDETFRLPLKNGNETFVDIGTSKGYSLTGYADSDGVEVEENGLVVITAEMTEWLDFALFVNGVKICQDKNNTTVENPDSVYALNSFVKRGDFVRSVKAQTCKIYPAIGNGSLYFYVGETVQNANLIDAGRFAEQLSLCYKKTTSDNSLLAGMGMPDVNNYVDLTLAASQEEYTAPFNGWLHLAKTATAANQYIAVFVYNKDSGGAAYKANSHATGSGYTPAIFIPIEKGTKFMIQYTTGGSTQCFRMIHLIGEGG